METTSGLVSGRAARAQLPVTLSLAAGRQHTAETILKAWLKGKAAHTIRSYQHDLEDFALFLSRALGMSPRLSATAALDRLFRQSSPSAHEIVLAFRHHLVGAGLAPASVNRHLGALRSVSKLGRMLGLMTWCLEVPGVKAERRRDTRGPSTGDIQRMLAATQGDTEAETRDAAIVTVLFCLGLRVSELCGLDYQDINLDIGNAWIRGKGRRERELVPVPLPATAAIRRYLVHRGTSPGPLFQSRRRPGRQRDGRLETRSVLRIVRALGQRVGLHVWCHGLRHTAITTAIQEGQRAGVGLDQIRAFSRHRTLATMLLYRDEHDRAATQSTLTNVVAKVLSGGL